MAVTFFQKKAILAAGYRPDEVSALRDFSVTNKPPGCVFEMTAFVYHKLTECTMSLDPKPFTGQRIVPLYVDTVYRKVFALNAGFRWNAYAVKGMDLVLDIARALNYDLVPLPSFWVPIAEYCSSESPEVLNEVFVACMAEMQHMYINGVVDLSGSVDNFYIGTDFKEELWVVWRGFHSGIVRDEYCECDGWCVLNTAQNIFRVTRRGVHSNFMVPLGRHPFRTPELCELNGDFGECVLTITEELCVLHFKCDN